MLPQDLPAGFSESLTEHYLLPPGIPGVIALEGGLINQTWKLSYPCGKSFILQKINLSVFPYPRLIEENIKEVGVWLRQHHPQYLFAGPLATYGGKEMFFLDGYGQLRMYPFIEGSHTLDVIREAAEAYEAAFQFANFTYHLKGLEPATLAEVLPDFHNAEKRYRQFLQATLTANAARAYEAAALSGWLKQQSFIIDRYRQIVADTAFKTRVMHHDTKISNVLFGTNGKALCVIDLDTVMPGKIISDIGDMIRTYVSPVSEECTEIDKISFRMEVYTSLVSGYTEGMRGELSDVERAAFPDAGKIMIYIQALRFLTDFLNNDVYYGAAYPRHNLVRAQNQAQLLQLMLEHFP